MRTSWTPAMERKLTRLYATRTARECAETLGVGLSAVHNRVTLLGLTKSSEWKAECTRRRWAEGRHENSRKAQFRKGQAAHNKGRPQSEWMPDPGRGVQTRFKKGEKRGAAQHNWVPIGTEKIRDGLLVRKLSDDPELYPAARWQPVHRLVWEAANGPVPHGHVVRFREGRHTTIREEIALDRLELVSRAENMRRNSYHTHLPPEVARLVQLRGALNRKINNRLRKRDEEQGR